ncbi:TetR/AcrR family transcriptional regulator [Streptomyces sp. DH37]|uniref:TetR/AcrR family transcriptional regulator n=1 Tax=Streptomyces sp. DH37 TaxID=3040122 RepID=UPI00244119BE|nr:helix-turn-helix domain containing protein [Streptomyces sp. DH37]MDG9705803.1 helix-turn-helix domain containing protein [Streptomyces sp. DH37]
MDSRTRWNATRQRLYEAAVTLIAEQGFSATTVEEIAERAGVAKGTVYYNFTSKTGLLEALLRHGVGMLSASLEQAARDAARSGGGRGEVLDAMVRAGLVFADRCPAFTQLYVAELWRTNRAWRATLTAVRRQVVAVVEEALRGGAGPGDAGPDGAEPGGPDGDLDVPLAASALVGTVLVTALDWKVFQPERSLEEVHGTLSLLLRGRIGGSGRSG